MKREVSEMELGPKVLAADDEESLRFIYSDPSSSSSSIPLTLIIKSIS
jgi:hypothetical protein